MMMDGNRELDGVVGEESNNMVVDLVWWLIMVMVVDGGIVDLIEICC